jgi:outer membrane protein
LSIIKKSTIILPLLCLILWSHTLGQSQEKLDESSASLLEQVTLRQFDGREVAELPLALVLKLAIERSLSLKVSRLGEDVAQNSVIAAQERNTPSLTTSFGYANTPSLSLSSSSATSELSGTSTNSLSFSSAYSKIADSGITYGLTYSEQTKTSTTISVDEFGGDVTSGTTGDPLSSASLTGSVSIPFFQDWGSDYNELPVRIAEVGVAKGKLNTRAAELLLLKQVASIYWDLVGILETVQVKKKAVELSEKLTRDNHARLEAGLLNSTEVRVSETQLMRDRQSLLSSRLDVKSVEDQVRSALNLKYLPVGLYPLDRPSGEFNVSDDINSLSETIYKNDTQISSLNASIEQNRYQLEQELNNQKTDMDLSLSYILNGYSSSTFGGTSDFAKSKLHGMSATLTWKIPLGDQATVENIQKKRLEQQQLMLQIEERKSQLSLNLQSFLNSLKLIEKEKQTAEAVSKLSAEQLRHEIERFKLGKSTSYQVSQFQQDVVEAKQQEIMISIRQEKIRLELLTLTGEFKEKYKLN